MILFLDQTEFYFFTKDQTGSSWLIN